MWTSSRSPHLHWASASPRVKGEACGPDCRCPGSDLGVTPIGRGGDCGTCPLQCSVVTVWGGGTQRPLHLARPSELRWGRGGDQGGPSAAAETLGQPPQARGPQSRSWCPPGGLLRGRSGRPKPWFQSRLCPVQAGSPGPGSPSLCLSFLACNTGGMGWRWRHRPQQESAHRRCSVKRHRWLTQTSLVPQASRGT